MGGFYTGVLIEKTGMKGGSSSLTFVALCGELARAIKWYDLFSKYEMCEAD